MTETRLQILAPLPPAVYARRPVEVLPFPLDQPGWSLFARARHGLWHGLRALGLGDGDAVLAPAYHHGSEIEALVRAQLTCHFYDATATLAPDEDELERLLGPRVRALYLIHYLGFPQDAARWRRWCDQRGLLLIEDAAQAWLTSLDGRPAGSFGDLAIFCLYKTFGLPDGAAAIHAGPLSLADPLRRASLSARPLLGKHLEWLESRAPIPRRERDRGTAVYVAERDFALGDPASDPSVPTSFLLSRLVARDAALGRRLNYQVLLDELGEDVRTPFTSVPQGASPFVFPIETEEKSALLERLDRHGIRALNLWSVPHPTLRAAAFAGAEARRARVVGLPVHQELRRDDLDRIVTAIRGGAKRRRRDEVVERFDSFDPLADEWDGLAVRARNVFATLEWLSLWWRHFGRQRPLLLSVCRRAGRTIAILPLYRSSARPLTVIRFVGHGPSDQLGPVCAPCDRVAAAAALRDELARLPGPSSLFLGEELPADEHWGPMLGARALYRIANPVLHLRYETWEQYLATRSASLRKDVRRNERRLERDHAVRYRLTTEPARLSDDLDTLFRLHAMRWSDAESGFTRFKAFHREFAALALDRGWLRLSFLELDGEPVAAWYGFRFCGVQFHYQSGWDPAWRSASVGSVLVAQSLREALEDGLDEYRFLRGRREYKDHFASDDPGLETVILGHGALGRAAALARVTASDPSRVASRLTAVGRRLRS